MAFTKVAPAGIGSTPGDGYRIGDSFLHSTGVEITNINATGIVTAASLDISGAIDFDGHTELDNVNISGVSTFAGNIDANGDLDVDGHTNLDNVSVAGVSTFSGIVAAGVGSTAVSLANGKMLTFGSEHEMEMFHDGSQSYIKQRYFAYPSALNIISENSNINIMSGSGGNMHGGYENAVTCTNNGPVKLYWGGILAFETTGYGAKVVGSLLVNMGQLRIEDTILHDGDTDTKIRFPTHDTITFETGGSERLRIDSVGNLGFGMTPNTWHANNQKVFQISGTNAGLNIFTRAGSAHLSSNFIYNSGDAGVFQAASGYAMHHAVNATNGTFDWKSSSAASSSAGSAATMVTRLRIDSSGRVMIRTTTAGAHSSDLTIGDTTGGGRIMIRSANNAGGYIGFQDTTGSTVDGQIEYNHILNSFNFYFGSQERFRIHTQGMLGLSGANYGTSGQVLTSGGTGSPVSWTTITGTTINNNANNRLITGSGTANTLEAESTLTYDGNQLNVVQTTSSSDSKVVIANSNTPGSGALRLEFQYGTGTTEGTNRYRFGYVEGYRAGGSNDGGLIFGTKPSNAGAPTERLRINPTGDIGINYNGTPNATLDIRTDRDPSNGLMCFIRNNAQYGNGAFYGMDVNSVGTWSIGMPDNTNVLSIRNGGQGNSGTEYLRIDSNGRIGSYHNLAGTADYNRLMIYNPHSGSCWMQMMSTATGNSANTDGLSIGLNTSNIAHIWLRENADMYFGTNNSRRWTITSTGDLYPQGNYSIGLNSNTAFRMNEVNSNKFVHRYGTSGSATTNQQEAIWYGGGITVMHDNLTLSTTNYTWGLTGVRGYALLRIRNGAGSSQAIYAEQGTITSGSDYRMKENIEEITNGIETVKKLKPSIYNIRKTFNPNDDGKKHHGFVAHEVQEAIPNIGNIVSGTKDAMEEVFYEDEDENIPEGKKPGDSTGTFTDKPDYQGIDYGHMTPILAAAIKELITKVETLEAEVATLKGS